eukprot:357329-Chlamydomonas_euryale.AAC.18
MFSFLCKGHTNVQLHVELARAPKAHSCVICQWRYSFRTLRKPRPLPKGTCGSQWLVPSSRLHPDPPALYQLPGHLMCSSCNPPLPLLTFPLPLEHQLQPTSFPYPSPALASPGLCRPTSVLSLAAFASSGGSAPR